MGARRYRSQLRTSCVGRGTGPASGAIRKQGRSFDGSRLQPRNLGGSADPSGTETTTCFTTMRVDSPPRMRPVGGDLPPGTPCRWMYPLDVPLPEPPLRAFQVSPLPWLAWCQAVRTYGTGAPPQSPHLRVAGYTESGPTGIHRICRYHCYVDKINSNRTLCRKGEKNGSRRNYLVCSRKYE